MQLRISVEVSPDEGMPSDIGAVGIVGPQDEPYMRFSSLVIDALRNIADEEGIELAEYDSVNIFFPQSNEAILLYQPGQMFEDQLSIRAKPVRRP